MFSKYPFMDDSSGSECGDFEVPLDHHVHKKGEFFGCYLLVSKNPKYPGRTYIGFTVNPNRRLRQHNEGHQKGGARRTSGRGPWDMVFIVHGFPSSVAALRFEWAWQHPVKSRRLGAAIGKRLPKETVLKHRLRVVSHMLRTPPWSRLPLTLRWLNQDYEKYFTGCLSPPVHMPIAYGLVDIRATSSSQPSRRIEAIMEVSLTQPSEQPTPDQVCSLCKQTAAAAILKCYHHGCSFVAHTTCLAPKLCEPDHLIPINGPCPSCSKDLLWGELVRQCLSTPTAAATTSHQLSSEKEKKIEKPPTKKQRGKATRTPHWTESLNIH